MTTIEEYLNIPPYSLRKEQKQELILSSLAELTQHHYSNCIPYRRMLDAMDYDPARQQDIANLPFLPVRLFKTLDLVSVGSDEIVKTMTSSGTTGQAVSKIYLDRSTSAYQTKALTKIVSAFIGTQRLPMIILDTAEVVRNRQMFSARGAGILGFSMFGSTRIYALDESMKLNLGEIEKFLDQFSGKRIFLFGFTFIIWQHFYREILKAGLRLDLSNAVLIHGGGWKKLINESVTPAEFRQRLKEACGIEQVHDYYGMVEQPGSIFMECEAGHLHASVFSDVIIRNSYDFSVTGTGQTGLVQVLSVLPHSYPGHSLLTEDEGVLLGEDDCRCGRPGKYFMIKGRVKNAELRGCSDVYATRY
jgi:phenylacetate-coenzyme A ligase PaaK-like adenylate-forming protein